MDRSESHHSPGLADHSQNNNGMNLYLSSFEFGNEVKTLKRLASGRKLGFIPNALDYVQAEARAESNGRRFQELLGLGIDAVVLDLTEYFGNPAELRAALAE